MTSDMHALPFKIATSVSGLLDQLQDCHVQHLCLETPQFSACLPFQKTSAFSNVIWQAQCQLASALYHNAMASRVADVNELCLTDWHYCSADKIVWCCPGFWPFLSLDGAEIAAATLCCTYRCPTCESSPNQSWTTLKNSFLSGKPVRSRSK
jgi:hypothetical protein